MEQNFKYNEERDKLLELTETVSEKLALLLQFLNEEFLPISKQFKKHNGEDDLKADKDSDAVIFYKQIKARIITNLQYHDIIHQRIEHVLKVNSFICKELQSISTPFISEDLTMVPNLDKISQLNLEQVKSITDEYHEIREKIKHDLSLIQYYITKVSTINLYLTDSFTNSVYFDNLMHELSQHFSTMGNYHLLYVKNDMANGEKWIKGIEQIQATYTMQSEREVMIRCFPETKNFIPAPDFDNDVFS